MTDDLMKEAQLQLWSAYCDKKMELEAANARIETLEAALQAYVGDCDTTCCSPNHRRRKECGYTARKALEGKDD